MKYGPLWTRNQERSLKRLQTAQVLDKFTMMMTDDDEEEEEGLNNTVNHSFGEMEGKNHKKYELIYLTYFVSAFLIFFK
jgi:hypothetical protein